MKHVFGLVAALAIAGSASAATLGDDGLHKAPWMHDTFKDLREDFEEAQAEGKRLLVMVEQRGCIYCTKMHEDVYPTPAIEALLDEKFFVVQINMFGDVEVTDVDGTILSERDMVMHWGMMFTPTLMFYPTELEDGAAGTAAAAVVMPGAFGKSTFYNMLTWVLEEGYLGDENFQKYHARKFNAGMPFSE